MVDLDGLLPADHRARLVWSFVESLDLSQFYDRIGARGARRDGRPPIPRFLLSLWLYATIEGIGSARELERLAESDAAYRWLSGGVPLNYHGLADFRVKNVEVLDRLLTQSVTALIGEGLMSAGRDCGRRREDPRQRQQGIVQDRRKIAQDRSRGRQAAGRSQAGVRSDPGASSRRRQAARERAARDVQERASRARAALERLEAERKARAKTHGKDEARKKEPRASTTDPEARSMRFPDGAVRPAYNAQIAAAPKEGVIVSIEVTTGATMRAWREQ